MKTEDRDRNGSAPGDRATAEARRAVASARRAVHVEQTASDAEQTSSDADQTASDADQTASDADQGSADNDQRASDLDQATADRDRAADATRTGAEETAYEASRVAREAGSSDRLESRIDRSRRAVDRDLTATGRDVIADARDSTGLARDARTADVAAGTGRPEAFLLKQFEELAAEAAADRARAAADRARAAIDRANAARERARLESELRLAHLDELTGAYRREMGRLALSHEIDRARRSDGRFVLAFVDVDGLKAANDRDGHAAGDRILQTVVRAMRARLRSFDPIVRYGGDEFVCGLGGTDVAEAGRRFESIAESIMHDVGVGISVGLAALTTADDADRLTERADAAMLEVKAKRQSRR